MANHKNSDHEFTGKRLSSLQEPEGLQPDAAEARKRLQRRLSSQRPLGRRLGWAAAAVAIVFAGSAVRVPGAAAMNGGSAVSSVHELMGDFHWFLMYHYNAALRVFRGDPAPDFTLADASGNPVKLSDYKGKVVLLNFWATWCQPCKTEIPWFMELQSEYAKDVAVLGVSMDEEGWKAVRPFIEARRVNYPVMLASPQLPGRYRNIENLPVTFLIDRAGNVVEVRGALDSKAKYEEWLKRAL